MTLAKTKKTKRLLWVFISVLIPVQFAPSLDRVIAPVLSHTILAAPREPALTYEFEVLQQGIVLSTCAEGASRLSITPSDAIQTPQGTVRKVRIDGGLCTEFGFKYRSESVYLPEDLFSQDSGIRQGIWETRTYTGIPSSRDPEKLLTLQVRRQQDGYLEISWIGDSEFEGVEYRPVRIRMVQAEDMVLVQDWNASMLPLKAVQLQIEHPFLHEPLILEGRLDGVKSQRK